MPRQANGPAVLGNGTADPLPDPPIAIGAEPKASAPIVLVYTLFEDQCCLPAPGPGSSLRVRDTSSPPTRPGAGWPQSVVVEQLHQYAMPQPVGHVRPRKAHCVPVAREPNAHPPFLARAGPLPLL